MGTTLEALVQDHEHELAELQEKIGYTFKDVKLLQLSLVHSSFAFERMDCDCHNETQEFLGDAVLDLAVGYILFSRFPRLREGKRITIDTLDRINGFIATSTPGGVAPPRGLVVPPEKRDPRGNFRFFENEMAFATGNSRGLDACHTYIKSPRAASCHQIHPLLENLAGTRAMRAPPTFLSIPKA